MSFLMDFVNYWMIENKDARVRHIYICFYSYSQRIYLD